MASAWGNSWGRAWGNSWGSVASPVEVVSAGGWVEYRKKKPDEPELTQTGHVVLADALPSEEEIGAVQALARVRKIKYNAVQQQRKDEEELMLLF